MRALAAVLLLSAAPALAARTAPVDKAREFVLAGDLTAAVTTYATFAGGSQDAAVVAENGWVLAKAGYIDLALARLDRALQIDATDPVVLYYVSSVMGSLGLGEAASELKRPVPGWLSGRESLPASFLRDELGKPDKELNAGTGLLLQRRYLAAADRFNRLTKRSASDRRAWKGLAIALESLGAFQAAARAVAQDIMLSGSEPAETRDMLAAHKAALEAKPPVESTDRRRAKANEMLKGRYLTFFGGSVNHANDDTIINVNGRVGKFLTDRFDLGANLGFISGYDASDYNGLTSGLSGRYLHPLPVAAPISATFGSRLQYVPAPSDKMSLYASPGLSYFLPNGSVDVTLDWALSGALKGTKTLSVGYTMYLGGVR